MDKRLSIEKQLVCTPSYAQSRNVSSFKILSSGESTNQRDPFLGGAGTLENIQHKELHCPTNSFQIWQSYSNRISDLDVGYSQ